jgi:16S rRNA (cytidine1402-2'-O)-methyltransferase
MVSELLAGKNIALVSDAGMPGISDPGYHLVKAVVQSGIKVVPVPGPTAAITGLVISGLPTDRFVFEGFLPRGKKQRALRLQEIAGEERTVVIYEAPHRLRQTLEELAALDGEREVAVARELTKTYEEIVRGSAASVLEHFKEKLPRGEFTVIIGGAGKAPEEPADDWPESIIDHVAGLMARGLDKKQAMKEAAVRRGISKKEVYNAMIGKQ